MAAVVKRRSGKRPRTEAPESTLPKRKVDEKSPVILSFQQHRQELDSRHDKHERLVKCSRDVTIASKRIIFLLQRVTGANDTEQIFKEADEKFLEVKEVLKTIALELEGEDPFLFTRAYSTGVQEYIEALSFAHFLKRKTLISFDQVKTELKFLNEEGIDLHLSLNPFDYVLGIADLTGELMRFCINSASSGDQNTPFEVCSFLREIHNSFVAFGNVSKDIASKLRVLTASMKKVEVACYTLKVRGSEIPQFAMAEALSADFTCEERDVN
ncbi:translin-associated protein X-like [Stylophora pistillata]|uniref:translin-associated protein X-like n=1 Tax=Stylophora pistillata TaxID=50429 RepID=UPI000C03E383|nr:translin-associated protein X-like [Stylophora pistillata]